MNTQLKNSLLLLICAFLWGSTFVAQSIGANYVGPFTYVFGRSIIAVVFLTPVIRIFDQIHPETYHKPENTAARNLVIKAGVLSGIFLMIASVLQQKGMETTSVGKSGFLTALYIVLVPITGIFLKKKASVLIWIGVVISLIGLYLLCIKPGELTGFAFGDIVLIACAVFFSVQIHIIDHFSPLVDGIRMSRVQFMTVTVLSFLCMLIWETPTFEAIWAAKWAILYAGCLSSGVAYTLQIIGQKDLNPTIASMIMSLESAFSLLCGWIFLHESMSGREMLGAAFMFAAVILCQLPTPKKKPTLS